MDENDHLARYYSVWFAGWNTSEGSSALAIDLLHDVI